MGYLQEPLQQPSAHSKCTRHTRPRTLCAQPEPWLQGPKLRSGGRQSHLGRVHGEQQQSGVQMGWLIPHSRNNCLWEQELTSTDIFYGLRPVRALSAMAVGGSRAALQQRCTLWGRTICSVLSHRNIFFCTCLSFLPVQTLAQLADPLVHHGHLHVAFIQELLLLLQLWILFLVELVTNLQNRKYNVYDLYSLKGQILIVRGVKKRKKKKSNIWFLCAFTYRHYPRCEIVYRYSRDEAGILMEQKESRYPQMCLQSVQRTSGKQACGPRELGWEATSVTPSWTRQGT